jgi:hypothetical protein
MTTPLRTFRLSDDHLVLLDGIVAQARARQPQRAWDRSAALRHMIESQAKLLGVAPVPPTPSQRGCALPVPVPDPAFAALPLPPSAPDDPSFRCPTCGCVLDVDARHTCLGCPRCHKPLGPAPHRCFA